ncbi:hypothetical protein ID856_18515, partial [Xenorhabdus sp. 18]
NFTPLETPTGLFVYDYYLSKYVGGGDSNIKFNPEPATTIGSFFNRNENGPVNLPDNAIAELRDSRDGYLFTLGKETAKSEILLGDAAKVLHKDKPNESVYVPNKFRVGRTDYGDPVKLNKTTLRTTVTDNQTGAMRAYTYTMTPKRMFVNLSVGGEGSSASDGTPVDPSHCENNSLKMYYPKVDKFKSVKLTDVWRSRGAEGKEPTLLDEYPDILAWKMFQSGTPKSVIKVNDDTDNDKQVGLDLSTRQTESVKTNDILVCLIYS